MFAKVTFAALLSVMAVPAMAAQCDVTIEGNDAMQFNTKEIVVDKAACSEFTVNLVHVGKLPKTAMGHNVVITKTADKQGVATDATAAGPANDYVKPNDTRVIAHTKLLGGGEKDSVTFKTDALEAGGDYTFFCSFPGHWAIMTGKVVVK
jgi:azurin